MDPDAINYWQIVLAVAGKIDLGELGAAELELLRHTPPEMRAVFDKIDAANAWDFILYKDAEFQDEYRALHDELTAVCKKYASR